MHRFAFILHALDKNDVARKYPIARLMPTCLVEWILRRMKPKVVSHITGIQSPTGARTEGWFVGCPRTARQLLRDPVQQSYDIIVQTARLAEELGAEIIGLGAFTSVVGDAGETIARLVGAAITTGNSYTVYTGVTGALQAARLMGINPPEASAAVLGATGAIGRVCALLLSREVRHIALAARSLDRLQAVASEVRDLGDASVSVHRSIADALKDADIVITVTSALDQIVEPHHLKPGAVVCDVARPRDVSPKVASQRPDVLVIEGGIVEVPGQVEFNFDFGFPPRTAYACMAETMILALEGRIEDYSIGRHLTLEQVLEIAELAEKHGFKLAGFRSFEKPVTEEQIARTREAAEKARAAGR